MKKLQNTLYVTTPEAYMALDGDNIVLLRDEDTLARLPLHNLENIVSFGFRGASPALLGACMERNIGICFLTRHGRFLARVSGQVSGNVLLRTQQYRISENNAGLELAKLFLTGKIYNGRWLLEHFCRDHPQRIDLPMVQTQINSMKTALSAIPSATCCDELMGIEGSAAKVYFAGMRQCILRNEEIFNFDERNRRPPLDPTNAMLSFTYTLLGNEIAGALESVGLDPAVGYLHALRPGRKSLALDLLEELRAPLADRFVLSQINLGVVSGRDFEYKENGACFLKEESRRNFLASWQKRKQEMLHHPFLKEKIPWGLVPYAQALLLSRYLRGDLDLYPPFLWK